MMNFRPLFLVSIFFLNVAGADAETLSQALLAARETAQVISTVKKTAEPRSEITYTLERRETAGEKFYTLLQKGRGDYSDYRNVTWVTEASIEEKDGLLYPLHSSCTIRDQDDRLVMVHKKDFNYRDRIVSFEQRDANNQVVVAQQFPIKGPITDDIVMIFFLRRFIAEHPSPAYRSFYLVSSEPHLYEVNIKSLGEEELDLPFGKRRARKFQLMADLGPLTELAAKVVPPTFVWYAHKDASLWLKYEGLETGRHSTYIRSILTAIERK